jgi:hypothetical protein
MNKLSKEQLAIYAKLDNHSDIEARGLHDVVHTTADLWCLCSVVEDPETFEDVVLLFHDYPEYDNAQVWDEEDQTMYTIPERNGSLVDGFRYWYTIGQKGGKLYVHNAMTYDKPVVKRTMPKCVIPEETWVDTFVMSKIQWFDRPNVKGTKSPHGLAAYGALHGIRKPPITDWTTMDKYKLHRVIEDVKIQKMCSEYLLREKNTLKKKLHICFDDAYLMESEYAETCYQQEMHGALADRKHMGNCVEVWDEKLIELEDYIIPLLPPTIKVSGGKVSRKEMAALMGFPQKVVDKMKERMITKKMKGEVVTVPYKPYYKPSINFTRVAKVNQYSGMHPSYGFSPSYIKKKELTDWIKENHPDTKPKDWDIEKVVIEDTVLNKNCCDFFGLEPEDTDIIVGAHTRVKFVESKMTQHEVTKGFLIKSGITWVREWNFKKDDNGMVKADRDMVVSYPPKAAPHNQLHYKIKKGDPIVTSPKIGEKEYEQLKNDDGRKVGEYNTTIHRRRFISNPKDPEEKGLIANLRDTNRLPCGVNNFATATGRSSHRVWVNAPGAGSLYGEEIRRCIVAPAGRSLVSSDMNSAQLSIAAYYANNYDYFQAVCYGQEFKVDDKGNEIIHPDSGQPWYIGESGHCTNSMAFELFLKADRDRAVETQDQDLIHKLGLLRKKSKAGTFGTIFGCSGGKLALMLGLEEHQGKEKKEAFLANIGLDRPIEILEAMCKKNKRGRGGYIELPFGYYAFCSSPHARFNYLDQGTEGACQKWAEIYFDREARKMGLHEYIHNQPEGTLKQNRLRIAQRVLSYHK